VVPRVFVVVRTAPDDGSTIEVPTIARLDAPADVDYLRHGGILPLVMRRMLEHA
jgi:aconitate hydratase